MPIAMTMLQEYFQMLFVFFIFDENRCLIYPSWYLKSQFFHVGQSAHRYFYFRAAIDLSFLSRAFSPMFYNLIVVIELALCPSIRLVTFTMAATCFRFYRA